MSPPLRRRLRAPQEDGTAFIDPPPTGFPSLIAFNQKISVQFDQQTGFPAHYRKMARMVMLTRPLGSEVAVKQFTPPPPPIVMTGHQPELFHPGVWFKNFLAVSIARQVDGHSANLVIDNDVIRSTAIRVPTFSNSQWQLNDVPFDVGWIGVPWELRPIKDKRIFGRFASEVRRAFKPAMDGPAFQDRGIILDRLWPLAMEAMETSDREMRALGGTPAPGEDEVCADLGETLAAARQRLEKDLGLAVADCWLSGEVHCLPFHAFIQLILARHSEFRAVHNAVLAEHRSNNGIRSRSHPFPDLAADGEWLEVPLWIWPWHHPRRRPVYVRSLDRDLELTDREDIRFRLPPGDARQVFSDISIGHFLRPRAVVTTMYARLVLSDLFIHGIGGAKYDEVTDEIIRRFFGIEPPKYITATATFRLPIERPHVTIEDVRDVRQKLRDVRYRPETFLRDPLTKGIAGLREQLQALADEKCEYVRTHNLRRCEEHVFARLDTINRAMHDLLAPVERELVAQQAQLDQDLRRAELLGSREFSFVLFPADDLPQRLLALSKVSA